MDKEQVELMKNHYKQGDRIKLIFMKDSHTRLSYGDEGTIKKIDDIGQIHVNQDCGSSLSLNYDEDEFITISKEEQ